MLNQSCEEAIVLIHNMYNTYIRIMEKNGFIKKILCEWRLALKRWIEDCIWLALKTLITFMGLKPVSCCQRLSKLQDKKATPKKYNNQKMNIYLVWYRQFPNKGVDDYWFRYRGDNIGPSLWTISNMDDIEFRWIVGGQWQSLTFRYRGVKFIITDFI